MLFEQRAFPIYDRIVGNVAEAGDAGRRVCNVCIGCTALAAVLSLSMLCTLHAAHVNRGGCFYQALSNNSILGCNYTEQGPSCFRRNDTFRIRIEGVITAVVFADPTSGGANASDFAPDYLFSTMREAVSLASPSTLADTPFRTIDVSLPSCARGSGFDFLLAYGLVAYDTVMVNDAMAAFPGVSGYLLNVYTGEPWNWGPANDMQNDVKGDRVHGAYNIFSSFMYRLAVLLESLFLFFLISSVCTLLIRVSWSSGPAILYPVVALLSRCFMEDRMYGERHLNRAVPWLGQHVRALRAFGVSHGSLIAAHLAWVLFVAFGTLASMAFTDGIYYATKSLPSGLPTSIWVVFLVAEMFSFVMLRSSRGIIVFPRVFLATFLCVQAYIFAFPYAFFDLAVTTWLLTMVCAMFVGLYIFEMPALLAGEVSMDKPRAFVVQVGGVDQVTALPQAWSLFMPVNARLLTVESEEEPLQTEGRPDAPIRAGDASAVAPDPSGGGAAPGDALAVEVHPTAAATAWMAAAEGRGDGLAEGGDTRANDSVRVPLL